MKPIPPTLPPSAAEHHAIEVSCEECHRPLGASRAGEIVVCPDCHYASIAPAPPPLLEPTGAAHPEHLHAHDQPHPDEKMLRTLCPHCRQQMAVSPDRAGTMVNCPQCHHLLLMPARPLPVKPMTPVKDPATVSHHLLHFRCHHCGQKMRVLAEHAGQSVRCPHCHWANAIPHPGQEAVGKMVPLPQAPTPAHAMKNRTISPRSGDPLPPTPEGTRIA